MELWKGIPDWEDLYEASSEGRVRALPRIDSIGRKIQGRIKKATPNELGYLTVSLFREGKETRAKLHALVCAAFNGPRPEGDIVTRHLDGDKLNNRAVNLVWGTRSENNYDTVRHGRSPAAQTHCKRGHAFDEKNTVRTKRGTRVCRTCYNMKARDGYARRKAVSSGRSN